MSKLIHYTMISGIIAVCASPANAATLYNTPSYSPPSTAPFGEALRPTITPVSDLAPPTWSGFYIGANAGGAWASSDVANIAAIPTRFPTDPSILQIGSGALSSTVGGFIGGVQGGYNFQFPNGLVAGVEVDFQGVTGKSAGNQSLALPDAYLPGVTEIGSLTAAKQLDNLGTVRGRLGYAVTPGVLAYGTAGLAYGHASFSTTSSGVAYVPGLAILAGAFSGASYSDTRTGWTAGAGFEWMTFPNWSVKAEYLYYDLGSVTKIMPYYNTLTGFNTPGVAQSTAHFAGSVARFGVSYHFNNALVAAPPLMAKY